MRRIDMYWLSNKNWYHRENGVAVINEDAPEDAKRSYNRYLEQCAQNIDEE